MRQKVLLPILLAGLIGVAGCGGGAEKQSAGGSKHPPGWGTIHAPLSQQRLAPPPGTVATMYDTITLGTVPRDPFALAGYTSGFWPTFLPLRHAYPNAHTVSIAISVRHNADCLDVEPGDASPAQAPAWVRSEKAAGWPKPCLYSSYYEFVNEVRPALSRAGISRAQVWEWDADYTYRSHIDVGFDGTQWTDVAFGRNLDASLVTRAFLAIAHPPLTAPQPPPKPRPPTPPTPNPRIAYLRSLARKHHCYRHGPKPHACAVWAAEVRALLK